MSHGLAPRPQLPPGEVAVVVAAVEALLRQGASDVVADVAPTWRFSGRWFNPGPFSQRRPRRH